MVASAAAAPVPAASTPRPFSDQLTLRISNTWETAKIIVVRVYSVAMATLCYIPSRFNSTVEVWRMDYWYEATTFGDSLSGRAWGILNPDWAEEIIDGKPPADPAQPVDKPADTPVSEELAAARKEAEEAKKVAAEAKKAAEEAKKAAKGDSDTTSALWNAASTGAGWLGSAISTAWNAKGQLVERAALRNSFIKDVEDAKGKIIKDFSDMVNGTEKIPNIDDAELTSFKTAADKKWKEVEDTIKESFNKAADTEDPSTWKASSKWKDLVSANQSAYLKSLDKEVNKFLEAAHVAASCDALEDLWSSSWKSASGKKLNEKQKDLEEANRRHSRSLQDVIAAHTGVASGSAGVVAALHQAVVRAQITLDTETERNGDIAAALAAFDQARAEAEGAGALHHLHQALFTAQREAAKTERACQRLDAEVTILKRKQRAPIITKHLQNWWLSQTGIPDFANSRLSLGEKKLLVTQYHADWKSAVRLVNDDKHPGRQFGALIDTLDLKVGDVFAAADDAARAEVIGVHAGPARKAAAGVMGAMGDAANEMWQEISDWGSWFFGFNPVTWFSGFGTDIVTLGSEGRKSFFRETLNLGRATALTAIGLGILNTACNTLGWMTACPGAEEAARLLGEGVRTATLGAAQAQGIAGNIAEALATAAAAAAAKGEAAAGVASAILGVANQTNIGADIAKTAVEAASAAVNAYEPCQPGLINLASTLGNSLIYDGWWNFAWECAFVGAIAKGNRKLLGTYAVLRSASYLTSYSTLFSYAPPALGGLVNAGLSVTGWSLRNGFGIGKWAIYDVNVHLQQAVLLAGASWIAYKVGKHVVHSGVDSIKEKTPKPVKQLVSWLVSGA